MKRKIALIISSLFLLAGVGCGGNNAADTDAPKAQAGISLVSDFETSEDFDVMRLFGVLGTVEQNTDKTYVKRGAGSAKVTVDSDPYKGGAPYIQHALQLIKKGEDYRDFSNVSAVSLDVYNATGSESRIGLQLSYEHGNGTRKNFTLPEGWSTVRLDVKREYIPQTTNTNNVTAPFVDGLRIMFDRASEDSVYYLDNLQIYKTGKSFTPITMQLQENEICSFDSEWQVELLQPSARPELLPSYNQDKTLTSTGTGGSLRVEAPAGSGQTESWPGFELNNEMLKLVPWADYPNDAKFCFDVYAPTENGMDRIWLTMTTEGERYYVTDEIHLAAGKWQTVSISVSEMNSHPINPDKTRYNFANTTSVVIRWAEHAGVPHVFYLDNFRMEYSGNK